MMKCPSCGSDILTTNESIKEKYGFPLSVCDCCNNEYLSRKKEIALSGISFLDRLPVRLSNIFKVLIITLINVVILSCICFFFDINAGKVMGYIIGAIILFSIATRSFFGGFTIFIFPPLSLVFFFIPFGYGIISNDVEKYKENKQFFKNEKEDSIKRCKNEDYVRKLIMFGYKTKRQSQNSKK